MVGLGFGEVGIVLKDLRAVGADDMAGAALGVIDHREKYLGVFAVGRATAGNAELARLDGIGLGLGAGRGDGFGHGDTMRRDLGDDKMANNVAHPRRFERLTTAFGGRYSIH